MSFNSPYFEKRHLEKADPEDDVSQILSQNTYSFDINISGVSRADGAQLPSNSPCEDRFNHVQLLPLGNENWIASTVFDGHNGWQMAEFLKQKLLASIQGRLSQIEAQLRDSLVESVLKEVFVELDNNIIKTYVDSAHDKHMKLAEKLKHAQVALSGSCALLVLYNPTSRTLYTACTGDSRAILGEPNSDHIWERILLSDDQKGDNESEVARIRREHPGEEPVNDGKVLGMAVYRAFGDSPWKIAYDLQDDLGKRFWSQGPKEKCTIPSPPYLTAEPVVTVKKLDQQPCFLVLATDGLWDECSSQEVVDLVVRWLKAQPENTKFFNTTQSELKIEDPPKPTEYAPGFDFLQRFEGFDARFWAERTIVQDLDNVAVHLLRNACGGNHEELLAGRLAAQPPYSRNLRDDITVQVIFFNSSEQIS